MTLGRGRSHLDRQLRGRRHLPETIGWAVAVIVSVLSVWLRSAIPLLSGGGSVDDFLFLRSAGYLAHGQWLGPFDQYTLLKGPTYPIFVAAMYRLDIPLKIGEQVTYLIAAAAVATCVYVVTRRVVLALGAYIVLALDPVNFDTWAARVTRDGWYSSLSLLLIATVFLAVYAAVVHARPRWLIAPSIVAGLTAGTFWLCREEPIWIVPTIVVVFTMIPLVFVLPRWRTARTPSRRNQVVRGVARLTMVAAIIAVVGLIPIVAVTRTNQRHYGIALTNDLASGTFGRAYADWRRVDGGASTAEDPITRAQREAVYAVSPLAATLQPFLDPARPCEPPRHTPHGLGAKPPCRRPVWDGMRIAAAKLGRYDTGSDSQAFWGALDAEIVAGCNSGVLGCTPRLPTQLQSLQVFSAGPFVDAVRNLAAMTITSDGAFEEPPGYRSRIGGKNHRAELAAVVRDAPTTTPEAEAQVQDFQAHDWPYRTLYGVYTLLIPCLFVTALVGMAPPIARLSWPSSALSVLCIACIVTCLVRIAFVALLTITQFPTEGIAPRYLLPAHVFLMAVGVVGASQLADAIWTRIDARGPTGEAMVQTREVDGSRPTREPPV